MMIAGFCARLVCLRLQGVLCFKAGVFLGQEYEQGDVLLVLRFGHGQLGALSILWVYSCVSTDFGCVTVSLLLNNFGTLDTRFVGG